MSPVPSEQELNRAVVDRALYLLFVDTDPERGIRPSGTWDPLWRPGKDELEEEAKKLSPETGCAELFQEVSVGTLSRRSWLVRYFREPAVPLYTMGQLADLIRPYRRFLAANREQLLENGTTNETFDDCPWLDARITPLYPTRFAEVREDDVGAPLKPFHPAVAHQLAGSRPELFDTRMSILAACEAALRARSALELCAQTVSLLQEAYAADDIRFLVEADETYARHRAGGAPVTKSEWAFQLRGSLSVLLLTVGHVVKEIELGTFHHAATAFATAGVDLRAVGSYFELAGHHSRQRIDEALDEFLVHTAHEQPVWQWYSQNLTQRFKDTFDCRLVIPRPRVPRSLKEKEPELRNLVRYYVDHLRISGSVPVLIPTPPGGSEAGGPGDRAQPPGAFCPSPGTTWEQVSITVRADDTATVTVGAETKMLNFSEMGFKNRTTGRPTGLWEALLTFAAGHGQVSWGKKARKAPVEQKVLSRLRENLRMLTGIDGNPFDPYDRKQRCYTARFKIDRP